MASYGVGPQPNNSPASFIGLMAPIHLPGLVSTDGTANTHLPIAHHVSAIEVEGVNDVQPLRTGYDFGQTEEFTYLANTDEVLKSLTLCVQLAGLDQSGAHGTNPRYVDDILAAAIEKIEFCYGSLSSIQTLTGDEIHFRQLQELKDEELTRQYKLQAAGFSAVERTGFAVSPQWVYLEIPFWWARKSTEAWHAWAYQRPTRIRITWRNAAYLLQSDNNSAPIPALGSGTPFQLQKFLRFDVAIPTQATKDAYRKMIEGMGSNGWPHLVQDWQTQDFTFAEIPSGGSAVARLEEMKLDMFHKYGYNLRYVIRPSVNLEAHYNNNNRFVTYTMKDQEFVISNRTFYPKTDHTWAKYHENGQNFAGNCQANVFNIPFTQFPDVHAQGFGGIDFSNVVQPFLKITVDSGLGDVVTGPPASYSFPAHTVTVWLECRNYVRLFLEGEASKATTALPL